MPSIKTFFDAAAHLFYPYTCKGCGSDLLQTHSLLCIKCIYELPHTNFEKLQNNPTEKLFYGRVPIHHAHSGYYFAKGTLMQALIHDFKYAGNLNLGNYLSKIMAERMLISTLFKHIDYIIPLPLFAEKEYKRGFNQAKIISDGISEVLNVPILPNNLVRITYTETQTKKRRTERWDNVAESFLILQPEKLQNKHVLLVDDVVTTGATLEACAQKIDAIKDTKISVVTLAIATK